MPVSHRMISHGKYIKASIHSCPESWLYVKKCLIVLHLSWQCKIKVAACHIQIMDWQICKRAGLNGILKLLRICSAAAECTEPGKIIQALTNRRMISRHRAS